MATTPTRKTNEQDLAAYNAEWRASPIYQEALRFAGVDPTQPRLKLNDRQQSFVEFYANTHGFPLAQGMKIDNAGNFNQVNSLMPNIAKGAAVTGAALTGLGAAGIGPMAGLFGATAAPAAASGLGMSAPSFAPAMGGAIPAGWGTASIAAPTALGTTGAAAAGGGYAAATPLAATTAPSVAGGAAAPLVDTGAYSGLFAPTGAGIAPAASTAATTGGAGGAGGFLAGAPGLGSTATGVVDGISIADVGGPGVLSSILGGVGGWPGVASMGLNALGGFMSADAARDAARLQAESVEKALQLQRDIYNQNQANFAPYLGFGQEALDPLRRFMGFGTEHPGVATLDYLAQDPSYQFRLRQGLDALQGSAAAKGTLLTGGTMKDLNTYAQESASQEADKIFSRLFDTARLGQNSAAQQGTLGASYANSASNLYGDLGNAAAAGRVGSANAWNQMLTNWANQITPPWYTYPPVMSGR